MLLPKLMSALRLLPCCSGRRGPLRWRWYPPMDEGLPRATRPRPARRRSRRLTPPACRRLCRRRAAFRPPLSQGHGDADAPHPPHDFRGESAELATLGLEAWEARVATAVAAVARSTSKLAAAGEAPSAVPAVAAVAQPDKLAGAAAAGAAAWGVVAAVMHGASQAIVGNVGLGAGVVRAPRSFSSWWALTTAGVVLRPLALDLTTAGGAEGAGFVAASVFARRRELRRRADEPAEVHVTSLFLSLSVALRPATLDLGLSTLASPSSSSSGDSFYSTEPSASEAPGKVE